MSGISIVSLPEDGDTITVDSVTYEFDINATFTNTQVDISDASTATDAALALYNAQTGASSHMYQFGTELSVHADAAGTAGNSIAMSEPDANEGGSVNNINLSGANLVGGSDSNASPFQVNHASTFGTVSVTNQSGGAINPGDSLRFTLPQANIADADISGTQDTIDMYICDSIGFTYGASPACTGTEVCNDTAINPTTTDATCDETGNTLVPPSDTGGSEDFYVYVQDSHDFAGTGTNLQSYTIANSVPTHDDPELDIHAATLPNSVGYWQFEDGASATSFDDETSNSNDGSCTACPDWTAEGYSGGAYVFNGTNDIITMGSGIESSSDFTLSVWARRDTNGADDIILSQGVSATNNNLLHFGFRSTNVFTCSFWGNDLDTIATYTDTNWHYWTCTYDSDTNTRIIYRDGILVANDTAASDFLGSGGINLGDMGGTYFDGNIDEPHIYDRALTADEISQIYAAYAGAPETNLVSHWSFNDGPDGFAQAMGLGPGGSLNDGSSSTPSVIKDGNVYKMWFAGNDEIDTRILYSTFSDGITWSTPVQALTHNLEGNWDADGIHAPSVLKDGSTYKMWYTGYVSSTTTYRILYTTSTDGINWNTPVQALSNNLDAGDWDDDYAFTPSVLKDGSTYKMWYTGRTASGPYR
ncbi:hypothetical protein KAR91_69220, partial [Candidatus Pacearchaeota archaeon]|nr:hypothetical protein [Candidatus Pacearchaeota archaeon]